MSKDMSMAFRPGELSNKKTTLANASCSRPPKYKQYKAYKDKHVGLAFLAESILCTIVRMYRVCFRGVFNRAQCGLVAIRTDWI